MAHDLSALCKTLTKAVNLLTVVWILVAFVSLLFLVGLGIFCYAFVRMPIPDPTTEKGRKAGKWTQFSKEIIAGNTWFSKQAFEPLEVISYDGKRLYGRFVPRENAKGTILFFHGYRSHFAVDFSASMEFYHQQGYNALFCDQRAHGHSQGHVLTFGIKEHLDVLSWVTYLGLKLGEDHPIFLSGISMGAATVLMAADIEFPANVRGIIADCGFTSPGDQLRYLMKNQYHLPPKITSAFLNFFTRIFGGFGLDQWSTVQALANAKYPVLLVHGLKDNRVPFEMSQRAWEACTGKKRLELFPNAGHGVSYLADNDRYKKFLLEFLAEHTPCEDLT